MQPQPIGFRIVSENLAVAAPVECGFDLPLHLILRKMLIQNVSEEFQRHCVVRLVMKGAMNLLDEWGVRQSSLAKEELACSDVRINKRPSARSELDIALFRAREPEQRCTLDNRQQVVDFHQEFFGHVIQILSTATIAQQL